MTFNRIRLQSDIYQNDTQSNDDMCIHRMTAWKHLEEQLVIIECRD